MGVGTGTRGRGDVGLGDVGLGDMRTRGLGDAGTWGRGTQGLGDVVTRDGATWNTGIELLRLHKEENSFGTLLLAVRWVLSQRRYFSWEKLW